jgi:hypothetical protein
MLMLGCCCQAVTQNHHGSNVSSNFLDVQGFSYVHLLFAVLLFVMLLL